MSPFPLQWSSPLLMYLKFAFISLKTHKLRTLLTTLGIIIGVMTVITMMSIIEGLNRHVYRLFGTLGTHTIYVQKHKWFMMIGGRPSRKEWREIAKRKDFTEEDAKAIENLHSIRYATLAQSTRGEYNLTYRGEKLTVNEIEGVTPKYIEITDLEITKGRSFIETDISLKRPICLIGPYIEEKLFKIGEDPINANISIGPHKFTVVGVLKERGQFMGQNLDASLIVPLTTLKKYIQKGRRWRVFDTPYIIAQVEEGYEVEEATHEIEALMRERRGCKFTDENDFELNTPTMILSTYRNITSGIYIAMMGIASLALIVGGIGIMNIMLVSVVERTREIGIRMAIGAKRKDILLQFLVEASALTSIGGILGVILGFGISKVITALTPLSTAVPLWSIFIGIVFSLIIGIFFGIYPALKASKLNPIEALRYE